MGIFNFGGSERNRSRADEKSLIKSEHVQSAHAQFESIATSQSLYLFLLSPAFVALLAVLCIVVSTMSVSLSQRSDTSAISQLLGKR